VWLCPSIIYVCSIAGQTVILPAKGLLSRTNSTAEGNYSFKKHCVKT
jgi:hypothetical protein